MNKETIKILSQGESINREFKECYNKIGNSVYETVCAFLNTKGGDIFLGAKDNKEIVGINKEYITLIKQDFVNSVNNQSKLSTAFCLSVEEVYI
ncbi:MAG: ATP-binding protein [Endomicrobium sp.]|jgi:ATP-dependent DNA helicase RecG|nr:ATP-binding protein [Endomicrobium sp.]